MGQGPQTELAIEPAIVVIEQREYLEYLTAADTRIPDKLRHTINLPKYKMASLRCLAANEHRAYLGFLLHEVVENRAWGDAPKVAIGWQYIDGRFVKSVVNFLVKMHQLHDFGKGS